MLQRIQSIFLLLASGSIWALFGLPFAESSQTVPTSNFFDNDQLYSVNDDPSLLGIFAVAGILALVAIFLFNNRALQIKLTIFSVIATILGSLLVLWFFMQEGALLQSIEVNEMPGIGLPVLAVLFGLLAVRFIRKDNKLVKSMDRLR